MINSNAKTLFGWSGLMNYISPSCKTFQGLHFCLGILLSFLVAMFIRREGSDCSGFLECFVVIYTYRSKTVSLLFNV